MKRYLNWKTLLVAIALLIVAGTVWYTNDLTESLSREETRKVELVVAAIKSLTSQQESDPDFPVKVLESNTTVPFIIAGEGDTIRNYQTEWKNLDLQGVRDTAEFLKEKLQEFKRQRPPIVSDFGTGKNYIYYGDSHLIKKLRYFPYVQLGTIMLFLLVVLIAIGATHRSMQNQVWVGLSKETAHQLGTPLSSITGWLELLREDERNADAVAEMEKDLNRLQLVADRFSKVGSAPQLELEDLVSRLAAMTDYMQRRAPAKVQILFRANTDEAPVLLSGPLFDWVIENLLRNALDALDGKGEIRIVLHNRPNEVTIDIADSGKGIPRHLIKKVFKPGFTTKQRGWGLGLSLARRIVAEYHHGSLFVLSSEPGKGTTFRIVLRR